MKIKLYNNNALIEEYEVNDDTSTTEALMFFNGYTYAMKNFREVDGYKWELKEND